MLQKAKRFGCKRKMFQIDWNFSNFDLEDAKAVNVFPSSFYGLPQILYYVILFYTLVHTWTLSNDTIYNQAMKPNIEIAKCQSSSS